PDRKDRRYAGRHHPLPAALAEHPDRAPPVIQVAQVQPAQLADPDRRGIQQLHDRRIPQLNRLLLRAVAQRQARRSLPRAWPRPWTPLRPLRPARPPPSTPPLSSPSLARAGPSPWTWVSPPSARGGSPPPPAGARTL